MTEHSSRDYEHPQYSCVTALLFLSLLHKKMKGANLLDTGETGVGYEFYVEASGFSKPKVKLISVGSGKKIKGEVVDLTDRNTSTGLFKRSLIKTVSSDEYGFKISDYFIAQLL